MVGDAKAVKTGRRSGQEPFHAAGRPLGFDLLGFWRWSASDLLSNATRGVLAEYLVARALGATDEVRAEWDPVDVTTPDGIRVEVKSSAYIQSWYQARPSRITFSICATRAWDSTTNVLGAQRRRHADVYVFCVLDHRDRATIDPLDVAQWRFFVASTERLNRAAQQQKTIGLAGLKQMGAREARYSELSDAVRRAAREKTA